MLNLDPARLIFLPSSNEHVEQITDNTDEVVIWRLFYQPPKPVNMEVKIGD
jgi:hypothetical protein